VASRWCTASHAAIARNGTRNGCRATAPSRHVRRLPRRSVAGIPPGPRYSRRIIAQRRGRHPMWRQIRTSRPMSRWSSRSIIGAGPAPAPAWQKGIAAKKPTGGSMATLENSVNTWFGTMSRGVFGQDRDSCCSSGDECAIGRSSLEMKPALKSYLAGTSRSSPECIARRHRRVPLLG
jgi:hypothetical protein